jgi:hypothetical protein
MKWRIHPERLTVEPHEDGAHEHEHQALEALVEHLHALRDQHREALASQPLRQHEKRAVRHRTIQLEERVVRARRRQRELGHAVPLAWNLSAPTPKEKP